jgi:predicted transcriptional regulator
MTSGLTIQSATSLKSILRIFSKQDHYDLINVIGDEVNNRDENLTPDFVRKKLNVTKRESNARIEVLMTYDLVSMINNHYELTTLGKATYKSLRILEDAIKKHRIPDTTDTLESSGSRVSEDAIWFDIYV